MQQYITPVLIFWVCVHIGFSLTQVADHYLFGRNNESVVPNYSENFIQSNRLSEEIDLTKDESRMRFIGEDFGSSSTSETNIIKQFICQFGFFGTILDFISKIYILDYEFFTAYEEETKDSIISWIFQAFRLASLLFGITFTMQIIALLFTSGILTTAAGLFVGGGALALGTITAIFQSAGC